MTVNVRLVSVPMHKDGIGGMGLPFLTGKARAMAGSPEAVALFKQAEAVSGHLAHGRSNSRTHERYKHVRNTS